MGTNFIRLDTLPGEVTEYLTEFRAGEFATTEFGGLTSVVTLRTPLIAPFHPYLIGIIHDFGMAKFKINHAAWALYGRSPLYGPVFVATDDGSPLDSQFVAMVCSGNFPSPEIMSTMDAWLGEHPEFPRNEDLP